MSKHHQYPSAPAAQAHRVQKQPTLRRTKQPTANPKHRVLLQQRKPLKTGIYLLGVLIIAALLVAVFDFPSVVVPLAIGASILVWFIISVKRLLDLGEDVTVHKEPLPIVPVETIDPTATYMLTSDGEVVEVDEDEVPSSAHSFRLDDDDVTSA